MVSLASFLACHIYICLELLAAASLLSSQPITILFWWCLCINCNFLVVSLLIAGTWIMSNWMRDVGQDAVAAQAATTSAQLPMYHGASLGISSPYVISPEASTICINIFFWYEIACSYCKMHIEDCYTKVAHNFPKRWLSWSCRIWYSGAWGATVGWSWILRHGST